MYYEKQNDSKVSYQKQKQKNTMKQFFVSRVRKKNYYKNFRFYFIQRVEFNFVDIEIIVQRNFYIIMNVTSISIIAMISISCLI